MYSPPHCVKNMPLNLSLLTLNICPLVLESLTLRNSWWPSTLSLLLMNLLTSVRTLLSLIHSWENTQTIPVSPYNSTPSIILWTLSLYPPSMVFPWNWYSHPGTTMRKSPLHPLLGFASFLKFRAQKWTQSPCWGLTSDVEYLGLLHVFSSLYPVYKTPMSTLQPISLSSFKDLRLRSRGMNVKASNLLSTS